MSVRKPLIAANWKMHPHPDQLEIYRSGENVDTVVFSTPIDFACCIEAGLITGAQYGHPSDTGARTGDISMAMTARAGCTHVLCGHSERRQYHNETNEFIAEQVTAALENGLHPILCIGETDEERKACKEKEVVKTQLETVLKILSSSAPNITLAYEPVWAIGTGNTATPNDAQEMHAFIRSLLPEKISDKTRILYGGSMKPENAESLLNLPDVDGGLIGGAALHPEKFEKIVKIAKLAT